VVVSLAASGYANKASDVYHKAQKLEKADRVIEAYLAYSEALALEPSNKNYRAKTLALQSKAIQRQASIPKVAAIPAAASIPNVAAIPAAASIPNVAAIPAAADPAAAAAPAENAPAPESPAAEPEESFSSITEWELSRARRALPPPQVKFPTGRFDFHINASPVDVFNQVAQRCGLQTMFDSEYNTTPEKVRFDIEDVDCREALRAAESATASFIAPLSAKLILVSKDTTQKRQANEQTMSVVVPIPTATTTQELTEIAQAVKQVSGVEKLAWSSATNEIVIRDRVSRVRIAMAVLDQLTAFRGGVVFDLRFLQLSDSEMLSYGVNLTNTFNVVWGANPLAAQAGTTLNNVVNILSRGWQAFGITALQASVVATLTESKSRTVLQTQIRSVNGLPATLHVGDKYPILTSGYFGPTSASTSANGGTVYTPPPSFTYQDLGVSLKILPVVGSPDLITLDVESEYQLLAGQSIDGIPVLANRKLSTRISLQNDEWAVIGGLMDETDTKSISGVAGAARIPLLGWLFKTQNHDKNRDHIVIVMKPHIEGEIPATRETPPMRVGSETRALSPL
jgi:general secretion pathway protein D